MVSWVQYSCVELRILDQLHEGNRLQETDGGLLSLSFQSTES